MVKKHKSKKKLYILIFVVIILVLSILLFNKFNKFVKKDFEGLANVNVSISTKEEINETPLPVVSRRFPEFRETYFFKDSTTNDIVWKDFNNDDYPDLFVGNFDAMSYLFINEKNKTFSKIDEFGINHVASVAISDFDQDGDLDVAIGNYGDVNLLFVNENPGFSKKEEFMEVRTKDNKVNAMVWGDFNKDNYPDLAVIRNNQQNYLFINNKDGTFTLSKQFGIGNFNDAAWADFDLDGFLDLIVGGFSQQSYIYYNRGTQRARLFDEVPFGNISKITSLAIADFNLDGLPDVAVANYGQQNYLYLNKGNRTFMKIDAFGKGNTVDIVAADLNNDGWQDVIVANYNEISYIYYNNGCNYENCTFTEIPLVSGYVHKIAVADYDLDGDLDIAVGRYTDKTSLFENLLVR